MRNQRIQTIVEMALSVALAVVINFMALRLPINIAGGSISLTMLPIVILALRRGPWAGSGAGALFGCFDLLMEPFILVPAQVVLDYPLPYLLLGLGVGMFANLYRRALRYRGKAAKSAIDVTKPSDASTELASSTVEISNSAARISPQPDTAAMQTSPTTGSLTKASLLLVFAVVAGGCLRFICHVLSGVLFFAEYAGDQNVWLYSLVYNVSYLGPSLLATLLCALLLMPILEKAVPAN